MLNLCYIWEPRPIGYDAWVVTAPITYELTLWVKVLGRCDFCRF